MRRLIRPLLALLLALGPMAASPVLGQPEQGPRAPPLGAACEAQGGRVSSCRTGRDYCRIAYPDAGRTCQDGSECQGGRCDFRGTPPPDGQRATGTCIAETDPCSCAAEVEDGHVIGLLCLEEADRAASEACTARGGTPSRAGFANILVCVQTYADAGRACDNDDDCDGACMATPGEGGRLQGRCQVNNNGFGCHQFWAHGRAGERLCVD